MKFEDKIIKQTKYSGYASHFQAVYIGTDFAKILCLAVSCILSTRFFEVNFEPYIGQYAFYGALSFSAFIAFFVGYLTDKLSSYYLKYKTVESWTLFLLLVAVVGGVACDFKGGEQYGTDTTGAAPVDSLSATLSNSYDKKIASITTQIEAIKTAEFYWCGRHNKAHRCESANFYIDPKRDTEAVSKIKTLEALRLESQTTANKLLLSKDKQFKADQSEHEAELLINQNKMRYTSIIATAVFLLLSYWQFKFAERVNREKKEREQKEAEAKKESLAKVDSQDSQNVDSLKEAMNKHFANLLAENNDILDEKLAQLEHEKELQRESKKEMRL